MQALSSRRYSTLLMLMISALVSLSYSKDVAARSLNASHKLISSTQPLNSSHSQKPEGVEVRKIVPPKLDEAHLGRRILCHRPMRKGSPKLTVETVKSGAELKFIANNYGHGGSGWTLAPGSSKYVVDTLLEKYKETYQKEMTRDTPIAVIGAGALGLFSALDLYERGFTKITVLSKEFDNLTSHNAGGLLAPVSMDNDPEMQKLVNKIGTDAYAFYKQVAKGEHPFIKFGARIVPTYFRERENSGLEPYVEAGVMEAAKDVILDFGNGTTQKMVSYDDGIFMDTGRLMTELKNYLNGKVTFKQQFVKDVSAVSQNVIVNCTGMGAYELSKDKEMVSVQGHLVMLKDQNPDDLAHMILVYFPKHKTKSGKFTVKRSLYMFPKMLPGSGERDVGVIGGTFIEGADENDPNEEEFDIMLDGAKRFYGLTKEASGGSQTVKTEL